MEHDTLQSVADPDGSWPPGRQYLAVRRAVEDEWQRCEFTGAGSRLRFVLASEWSEEGSTRHPAGTLVRAWIRNANGLRQISVQECEQVRTQGEADRFVSLAFHVCADGRHVAYSASGGGRAYFGGGRCWIDPADPKLHATDGLV